MFRKIQNFFKLKDQKWSDDKPLGKKLLNTYGNMLKVAPGTFRDFAQKQKTN